MGSADGAGTHGGVTARHNIVVRGLHDLGGLRHGPRVPHAQS